MSYMYMYVKQLVIDQSHPINTNQLVISGGSVSRPTRFFDYLSTFYCLLTPTQATSCLQLQ